MDDPLTLGVKQLLEKYSFEVFKDFRDAEAVKDVPPRKLYMIAVKIMLYDLLKLYDNKIRKCAHELDISYITIYRMLREKREEEKQNP